MSSSVPLSSILIELRTLCDKHKVRARKKYKDDLFSGLFPGASIKAMICPSDDFLNMPVEKFQEALAESGMMKYPGFMRHYDRLFTEMIKIRAEHCHN